MHAESWGWSFLNSATRDFTPHLDCSGAAILAVRVCLDDLATQLSGFPALLPLRVAPLALSWVWLVLGFCCGVILTRHFSKGQRTWTCGDQGSQTDARSPLTSQGTQTPKSSVTASVQAVCATAHGTTQSTGASVQSSGAQTEAPPLQHRARAARRTEPEEGLVKVEEAPGVRSGAGSSEDSPEKSAAFFGDPPRRVRTRILDPSKK